MLLEEWLKREGKSALALGREIGLKGDASVYRVIKTRKAQPSTVRRIYDVTGGEVTPDDIFDLRPVSRDLPSSEAAE